jgi:hypothetical protein
VLEPETHGGAFYRDIRFYCYCVWFVDLQDVEGNGREVGGNVKKIYKDAGERKFLSKNLPQEKLSI